MEFSITQAGGRSLADFANDIHAVLDSIAQTQRTTAVLQTEQGVMIVGGGARDLTPAQRALADSLSLSPSTLPGEYAEITVIQDSINRGLTPVELAVTRPICDACATYIQSTGWKLTSPTTASWR